MRRKCRSRCAGTTEFPCLQATHCLKNCRGATDLEAEATDTPQPAKQATATGRGSSHSTISSPASIPRRFVAVNGASRSASLTARGGTRCRRPVRGQVTGYHVYHASRARRTATRSSWRPTPLRSPTSYAGATGWNRLGPCVVRDAAKEPDATDRRASGRPQVR